MACQSFHPKTQSAHERREERDRKRTNVAPKPTSSSPNQSQTLARRTRRSGSERGVRWRSRRRKSMWAVTPDPASAPVPINHCATPSDKFKACQQRARWRRARRKGGRTNKPARTPFGTQPNNFRNGLDIMTRHAAPWAKLETRCSTTPTGTSSCWPPRRLLDRSSSSAAPADGEGGEDGASSTSVFLSDVRPITTSDSVCIGAEIPNERRPVMSVHGPRSRPRSRG